MNEIPAPMVCEGQYLFTIITITAATTTAIAITKHRFAANNFHKQEILQVCSF